MQNWRWLHFWRLLLAVEVQCGAVQCSAVQDGWMDGMIMTPFTRLLRSISQHRRPSTVQPSSNTEEYHRVCTVQLSTSITVFEACQVVNGQRSEIPVLQSRSCSPSWSWAPLRYSTVRYSTVQYSTVQQYPTGNAPSRFHKLRVFRQPTLVLSIYCNNNVDGEHAAPCISRRASKFQSGS
jgi:hypothetical protein